MDKTHIDSLPRKLIALFGGRGEDVTEVRDVDGSERVISVCVSGDEDVLC